MGFYKNLAIELQELEHDPELHEIVSWDIAHRGMLSAEERWSILTNEARLQTALAVWRHSRDLPSPKRAGDHVASQVRRRDLRPKRSGTCVLGWALIFVSLVTGVTVLVVNL